MRGSQDTCSVATWTNANDAEKPMTDGDEGTGQDKRPRASLLLVEDDDEIRASLEDVLSDFGYEVRAEPSADGSAPARDLRWATCSAYAGSLRTARRLSGSPVRAFRAPVVPSACEYRAPKRGLPVPW